MDIRKGVVLSRTNLIDSKKEVSIPWKGIGLILSIALIFWVGAFSYDSYVKNKINNLQSSVNGKKQSRDYNKIAQIADDQDRLNSVDKILTQRVDWEKLLQKMEENTLPEITFSNMEAKVVSQVTQPGTPVIANSGSDRYQMTLKGTSIGLNNLAKQISAFQGTKNSSGDNLASEVIIQKVDMKKTESGGVDKGGALDFTIQVELNPSIIKNTYYK